MMPCQTSGMAWSGCSATRRSAWPASDFRPLLRWPSSCSVISRSQWFFMPSTRASQAWAAASGRAARPRLSPTPRAVFSRRRRNMAKLLAGYCVVVGGTPTPQCNERLNDSPVAASVEPRLDDRFEQVAKQRAFAGLDIYLGDHAGADRQHFTIAFEVSSFGTDHHLVEGLLAARGLLFDGVFTDLLYLAFKITIDGVVVGGDLNAGGHARRDEGDILWPYLSFDQQLILNRGNLHDRFTGLDHPALGIDQDIVDPPTHRRVDLGALQLVATLQQCLFQCVQFGLLSG